MRYDPPEKRFKAIIYEEELQHIARWVQEYPKLETGGDLFGFWTHTGAPVVQFVLGPGEGSEHNVTSFYQDRQHLIEAGKVLRESHGLQHIGEWHSHHQLALAEPSSGDVNTVLNALARYQFRAFLLCIANLESIRKSRKKHWKVNIAPFLFEQGQYGYSVGSWVVLPGRSPIRESLTARVSQIHFQGEGHVNDWTDAQALTHASTLNVPEASDREPEWSAPQTTLEAPLYALKAVEVSATEWYASDEGKQRLKAIYEELQNLFGSDCKLLRTPQECLYFTFKWLGNECRLDFPQDFPTTPAAITVSDYDPISLVDWTGDTPLDSLLDECVTRELAQQQQERRAAQEAESPSEDAVTTESESTDAPDDAVSEPAETEDAIKCGPEQHEELKEEIIAESDPSSKETAPPVRTEASEEETTESQSSTTNPTEDEAHELDKTATKTVSD